MSIIPVAFSLMASFMSAITLLGVSSENYTFGIQFIVINISYGIFTPVAAYLYLPVFFKLQATSAYEVIPRFIIDCIQIFFVSVLGKEIRESVKTCRIFVVYSANDAIYGGGSIRSCFSFGGFNRNQ